MKNVKHHSIFYEGEEINLTQKRNWWDYGVNVITGYESFHRVIQNTTEEKKYIKIPVSLTYLKNRQSRMLSDNILDRKK